MLTRTTRGTIACTVPCKFFFLDWIICEAPGPNARQSVNEQSANLLSVPKFIGWWIAMPAKTLRCCQTCQRLTVPLTSHYWYWQHWDRNKVVEWSRWHSDTSRRKLPSQNSKPNIYDNNHDNWQQSTRTIHSVQAVASSRASSFVQMLLSVSIMAKPGLYSWTAAASASASEKEQWSVWS